MQKTYMLKNEESKNKEWFIIDATDQNVGRLATKIADILRGKQKSTYTPHVDSGDHVIVINSEKINFTGNKLNSKKYYRHSGHPGGLKITSAKDMLENKPEEIIYKAVKGMVPKNALGRKIIKKLHVVIGEEHKYAAQKPKQIKVGEK